eukprot:c39212_g1_i1.p1 GENE.c39212_g1_i1~~c39212_g1_i1.p1  ORF type:complete len:534 (+),score=131.11 c39212_g1_i1:59-1660(+)
MNRFFGKGKKPDAAPEPGPKPGAKASTAKFHKSMYNLTIPRNSIPGVHSEHDNTAEQTALSSWNEQWPELTQPSFKDTSLEERPALFLTKMKACHRRFVWEDGLEPQDDPQWEAKEQKRIQLVELVDYINQNPKNVFSEGNLQNVIDFVSTNIFRSFLANPTPPHIIYDPEEDEPLLDPSWPHLQYVMEFFLRFVVSSDVDPKVARKYISQSFILKLLDLFDSEDVRERDFLKTILHRIYGKFMQHRSFIRKSINNVFYHFLYNTERHNGISELLEILGSIINGFALPLKDEHKSFLRRSLIPLHKAKYASTYHSQLSYCITQFCEKDPRLVPEIISGILKYWPHTNSPKEVLFLQELEEVLELTQPPEFSEVMDPLFRHLSACIMSMHFQVAERALFYWHNEYIVAYIAQHRATILPIVFPALMKNSNGHWNATVHQLTLNVVKMFSDMDPTLFDECAQQYQAQLDREAESRKLRQEAWEKMTSNAKDLPAPPGWQPPHAYRVSILLTPWQAEVVPSAHVAQAKPLSSISKN